MTSDDVFVLAVEHHMRLAIRSKAASATRLLDAGGKRLRARLVWWSANAAAAVPVSPDDPALVHAAAAIELAHLGSLIHDDIVDGADTRRGVETLHRTDGVVAATDAGAAIAHLANEHVAVLGTRARRAVRRALLATCRGQVRELSTLFAPVSPRRRLGIMLEKTGAFFELAAGLGAIVADAAPRPAAAVRRFARRFGVAFQIADDVLDLTGDPAELGRTNGSDLREGVLTLPVLLASDPALPHLLAGMRSAADSGTLARCIAAVVESGGTTAATGVARWWSDRAVEALADVPASDARAQLVDLARTSIARGLRAAPCRQPAQVAPPRATNLPTDWSFVDVNGAARGAAALPKALVHLLDWFHHGLGTMVGARVRTRRVAARREELRRRLHAHGPWSGAATTAVEAIALAHALADPRALRDDPIRTLALVDALHCAGIAAIALAPSGHEHADLARHAGTLLAERADDVAPRRLERECRDPRTPLLHVSM